MIEDKYNLVSRGEIIEEFDKAKVLARLVIMFSSNEEEVSRIFDSNLKNIVTDLSWDKAIKYQSKLKSVGLVVYLDVVLNSIIFQNSLMPVTEQERNQESKTNILLNVKKSREKIEKSKPKPRHLLKFVSSKLVPVIVYPPHSEIISDESNTPIFTIRSYNYSINKIFIIILSLFFALLIQKYFSLLLVMASPGSIVTAVSIMIFFLVIIFLPKIMTPCRVISLWEQKINQPYILVIQRQSYNLFIAYYDIYSGNDELIATIRYKRLKSLYECFGINGDVILSCSEEHNVDSFTKAVTDELRDELFELNFLKYIQLITRTFKTIGKWFHKKPLTYNKEDGFIIRDRNLKKVSIFYREEVSAIEITSDISNTEMKAIVTAFSLICIGVD